MDDDRVTERILERTTEKIYEDGFVAFTMDDVARDSGISKKTLYRLIPSRHELIFRVVNRQIDRVKAKQQEILADDSLDYRQKLDSLIGTVSGILGRVQRKSMQEMGRIHPDLWEMIRVRRMEILKGMTAVLEEGQAEGRVRTDIPVSFLALYFQSVVDSMINPRTIGDAGMAPRELITSVLSVFFDGIALDDGTPKRFRDGRPDAPSRHEENFHA